MKKTLILCVILLLLCACDSSVGSTPDNQPPVSSVDYLPTTYAQRGEDGSFSLSVDADGDGIEELFCVSPANEDSDYPDSGAAFSVSRSGENIDSVTADGFYPVGLAAADLCAGDGFVELLVSCDYASDDYVTSAYRFDGEAFVFCGQAEGRVIGADNGLVTLKWYDHPLGTWWLYGNYVLGNSGRNLSLSGDYEIRPEDYSESGDFLPVLAVTLEVTSAEETFTLEEGTRVMPVRCDYSSYVDLLTDDGREFRINVRYIFDDWNLEHVMVTLPDGTEKDADEVFSGLQYWG